MKDPSLASLRLSGQGDNPYKESHAPEFNSVKEAF